MENNNLEVFNASSAEELFEMLNNEATPQSPETVTVEELFNETPQEPPVTITQEPPLIEAPKSSKRSIKPEMRKENSSLQSNQTERLKIKSSNHQRTKSKPKGKRKIPLCNRIKLKC